MANDGIREHAMAAMMNNIALHDSIGLGEDGPTHQPVGHLAAQRAIPDLMVLRPLDAIETAEAWEFALTAPATPSALYLSRQNLPTVRRHDPEGNHSRRGACMLRSAPDRRDVTLIATGSEVEIALAAADLLKAACLDAAVVPAPIGMTGFGASAPAPALYQQFGITPHPDCCTGWAMSARAVWSA